MLARTRDRLTDGPQLGMRDVDGGHVLMPEVTQPSMKSAVKALTTSPYFFEIDTAPH